MKEHAPLFLIINIASIKGANRLSAGLTEYCASKAAVILMSKALVEELAPHEILIVWYEDFLIYFNRLTIEYASKKEIYKISCSFKICCKTN